MCRWHFVVAKQRFKSFSFEIYCAKRSDFTKKKKKRKNEQLSSSMFFNLKFSKFENRSSSSIEASLRIVYASKRSKILLNETIRTAERVISWLWSGWYMFASNITASSRFHGPVPCAEACARWQAYCTRAYTIVRAAFIRFSVHFINAHRVHGSRRRQSGNHNALVHDYNGWLHYYRATVLRCGQKAFDLLFPRSFQLIRWIVFVRNEASSSLNSKELIFRWKTNEHAYLFSNVKIVQISEIRAIYIYWK